MLDRQAAPEVCQDVHRIVVHVDLSIDADIERDRSGPDRLRAHRGDLESPVRRDVRQ